MKSRDLIASSMREWRAVKPSTLADQLMGRLDADEVFRLAHRALAEEIRAELRTKDEHGVPKYGSLQIKTADGETHRVYKQTALFDLDERIAFTGDLVRQARSLLKTADAVAADTREKFGVQLTIPQLESGAA